MANLNQNNPVCSSGVRCSGLQTVYLMKEARTTYTAVPSLWCRHFFWPRLCMVLISAYHLNSRSPARLSNMLSVRSLLRVCGRMSSATAIWQWAIILINNDSASQFVISKRPHKMSLPHLKPMCINRNRAVIRCFLTTQSMRHDRGGKEHGAHTFSTTTCCYTVVAQAISQSLRLIAANSSEPRQPLTASLIPPRLIPTFLQPSFLTTPTSTRSPIRAHPHLLNPLLDHFNLHPNWPWDSLALLKGRLFVVLCG